MDRNALLAGGAVVLLVVAAFVMRGGRREDEAEPGGAGTAGEDAVSEGAAPEPDVLEAEPDDDWGEDEVVAVTSDGYGFLPDRHAVRLVPPQEEGEGWKAGESANARRGAAAIAASWHAGDFTGARVRRGGGDEPWRFEALGRDGEFVVFGFETRDAAEAALRLFETRGVIRVGQDEDGNPAPPSEEQFAEARRIHEETEQALALEREPEEHEG
ncbi:MAG: hypothetical protein IT347_03385 [Candidatus Eisenbacteria bacterium]|nr:hypothetical protein [Candidatus Eisenbacteria bacterium]